MVSAVAIGTAIYVDAVDHNGEKTKYNFDPATGIAKLEDYHPNRDYEEKFGLDPIGQALVKSQERVEVLSDRVRVLERQVDELQRAVFGHRIGQEKPTPADPPIGKDPDEREDADE